jgi:DNA helicase HerA-like ATPase
LNEAYIGREYKPTYENGVIVKFELDKPVFVDFSNKFHTFIISKTGGGKSYLAGVVAEEFIKNIENYGVVICDVVGAFVTLNQENDSEEINNWNTSIKRKDITPKSFDVTIWAPASDVSEFPSNDMYDKVFSLRACDLTAGTLCNAFDLDPLEQPINLFRKAQASVSKENKDYTLTDLKNYMIENGESLHFKEQTVDAIVSKIEALEQLKLFGSNGVKISEIIQEGHVAILDLSLSSKQTAKLIITFLAERIFTLRQKIARLITHAQKVKKRMLCDEYIPPTNLILDEAHKFMTKNETLKEYLKEGRNHGCILTAISQSPDLTKDLYANITHLFIGQMQFDDDIEKVKAMVPTKLTELRDNLMGLTTGCFYYYNLSTHVSKRLKVRPRQSLHPTETKTRNEKKYIKTSEELKQEDLIEIAEKLTKEAQIFYNKGVKSN